MKLLLSYDFLVVAIATMILAGSSSIVGCFSVYKGQSLIGDSIGHSAYPGIVLAYMITFSRDPFYLMIGAFIFGIIAYAVIQFISNNSKIDLDASLAIVLTGFFGLGIMLKTYVQGNNIYEGTVQSGLKTYIFGSASYIMKSDIYIISILSIFVLSLCLLFYKELILNIFDREFAKSIGVNNILIDIILLLMMIVMISVGLKMVGAILISSFLVIPCIFANQFSKNIKNVLFIAFLMATFSSFVGVYLSVVIKGFSTGPSIVVVMSFLTLLSFIFKKLRGKNV